jgi:cytochrome P450
MRDAATFTVDHPRFSTAQVVGPSMLSLDGEQHARHRACFAGAFRPLAVRERFPAIVAAEARRLVDSLEPQGAAELRRSYAGPLAAATITSALGLRPDEASAVLGWYDAIVIAVTEVTEGGEVPRSGRDAFEQLRARLIEVVDTHPGLDRDEVVSNAAVLLFGGIETMEGMIANAVLAILEHEAAHDLERAIEESLRLEPAAAMVDRYATRDVELGGSQIRRGELVHISITGANRDPAVFAHPDVFDPRRQTLRRHLAFAHGPHVCLGVHLARLEAQLALATLLRRLPGLRLDPERPATVRGLVFRKPPELHARWG